MDVSTSMSVEGDAICVVERSDNVEGEDAEAGGEEGREGDCKDRKEFSRLVNLVRT